MSARRRPTDNAAIERLVGQRREVVDRAVRVLETDLEVPIETQPDALRETVALLSVSLEELKVAEEELVQQNEELATTRAAVENVNRYFRLLFDEAPLPYVVTDSVGMIKHTNQAASVLFKRPAELLQGKPLLTLVPLDLRPSFRDAINRLRLVDGARDWHVSVLRHGDGPMAVTIDVRLARGAGPGEDLICWMLRPAAPDAAIN